MSVHLPKKENKIIDDVLTQLYLMKTAVEHEKVEQLIKRINKMREQLLKLKESSIQSELMKEITLIIYENNGGMDVFPCKNRQVADGLALAIVQEKRKEKKIPKQISDQEALKNWANLTDENIFIQEVDIIE